MKQLPKSILFLCCLIVILTFTGCSKAGESADQAVRNAFDALKANDSEKIISYFGKNVWEAATEEFFGDDTNADTILLMHDIAMKEFSYKIVGSQEEEGKATVTVEFTNANMGNVVQYFFLFMLTSGGDESDYRKIAERSLAQEDVGINTITQDVSLAKAEDGHWVIDYTETLAYAVFGITLK